MKTYEVELAVQDGCDPIRLIAAHECVIRDSEIVFVDSDQAVLGFYNKFAIRGVRLVSNI